MSPLASSQARLVALPLDWAGREPLTATAGGAAWGKGYAFAGGNPAHLLRDVEIAAHLAAQPDIGAAAAWLDGCFAAVVVRDGVAACVTDRYGSVPLFTHAPRKGAVVVADDPWCVVARLDDAPRLDDVAVLDMLRLGYVAGDRTLVAGVRVVPPATVMRVATVGAASERYWRLHYEIGDEPDDVYEARVERAFAVMGDQIDARLAAGARDVVLMLSGGVDTRSLAALLVTRGRSPVRFVSYGAPDDPDVCAAREVAGALGVPFERAPITTAMLDDGPVRAAIREVGLTTRFTCGAGARVAPLSRDEVVLTGHTGFLSSDYALLEWGVRTRGDVRRMVYAQNYCYDRSESLVRAAVHLDYDRLRRVSLRETTRDFDRTNVPIGELHRWNEEHRQRKLVFTEYRAYEQRASWMMPLASHGVVDVFCGLPWALRVDQVLYKWMLQRLCSGPAAGVASIGRVGGRLEADGRVYRRYRAVHSVPAVSDSLFTRLLAYGKRYGRRQRRRPPLRYGAAPLRHWFQTDGAVRATLLDRVDAIDVDVLRPNGVRAALLDARSGEWVFQLLLTGALTVQGVADEAARVWAAAR